MIKNKLLRFLMIILGFVSLGLGCIGIVLPILPTVPFFLLTSFCFVRSSEKFNKWFLNSKLYKKYLENFQKNKVMTLKSELILLISVSLMLMTSMYMVNKPIMSIVCICLLLCKYMYFIFNVKPVTKEEFVRLNNSLCNK